MRDKSRFSKIGILKHEFIGLSECLTLLVTCLQKILRSAVLFKSRAVLLCSRSYKTSDLFSDFFGAHDDKTLSLDVDKHMGIFVVDSLLNLYQRMQFHYLVLPYLIVYAHYWTTPEEILIECIKFRRCFVWVSWDQERASLS